MNPDPRAFRGLAESWLEALHREKMDGKGEVTLKEAEKEKGCVG